MSKPLSLYEFSAQAEKDSLQDNLCCMQYCGDEINAKFLPPNVDSMTAYQFFQWLVYNYERSEVLPVYSNNATCMMAAREASKNTNLNDMSIAMFDPSKLPTVERVSSAVILCMAGRAIPLKNSGCLIPPMGIDPSKMPIQQIRDSIGDALPTFLISLERLVQIAITCEEKENNPQSSVDISLFKWGEQRKSTSVNQKRRSHTELLRFVTGVTKKLKQLEDQDGKKRDILTGMLRMAVKCEETKK